ncbi:ammonia-dependent NAD(+) synthetase [Castellaniella caeni]|uniref:ammonia-dependent NAD(+) synthetase n=1 Tax=Castellaniella caeni TaxID=266123 RepID=UPI00082A07DF|nr:ammonia-dependent NAD(+) synthetase [Castellaniella caeni]
MLTHDQRTLQLRIRLSLGMQDLFSVSAELERRIAFLTKLLQTTGARALVLGISGGVDSLTAGCLAQRAVQRVRDQGGDARFVAMRLPYGTQLDEADAQAGLAVIKPDEVLTVDVRPAADAMLAAVQASGQGFRDAAQQDFLHGNIKARQRMIAQYAVAGARGGLVVGTDHAAEALMGFFTKFGDGAADVTPLAGLNKRRVRALASVMGAPQALVFKVPTADLELLKPLKPDEDAFGVSYEQIDDFLEGREVPLDVFDTIVSTWQRSAHKRALPIAP